MENLTNKYYRVNNIQKENLNNQNFKKKQKRRLREKFELILT